MAIELAKAYVQIVPSAEGIQGKLTEALSGESSKAGEAAGQLLGTKLVSTLKKTLTAAGIGKILKDSLNLGGALQQSIGGIETLFKDSSDTVKEYAAQAYRTVGLSANDYMEQTTSFAASLLSSVSHDANAAAQLANMAMVDMADNANKMGTDMQDIQNAYQGFAKQNYTMLDNLKLGYGGTQAEMQRLLNDASKLSGVKYDLGNLADMYSAIHIIQTELNITGTTAKEASTTLTGSFSAMSAAFQNVLGNLSTGADLTEPLSALAETVRTFLEGNLLPMIGNVLAGIPQVVYSLVPEILQSGTELLNSLAQGFTEGIPSFFANALPQLLAFTEELRANAGSFVEAGMNFITQLLNGLIAGLPQLISYVPDIIINLCGIINDNMPKILGEGVSIIVQLIAGIVQAVPSLLANWKKILQAVLSVISAINWLKLGKNILTSVANGVKSMGSSMMNAFKGGFSSALNWIKSLPSQAVQWGKNLLQSFINGLTGKGGAAMITTAGFTIAETASGSDDTDWSSVWSDANADIADSAAAMAEVTIPAYTKSGDAATDAAKQVQQAAKTITESVQWSVQDEGHSVSQNSLGAVTTASTELTEHILKSDGTSYDNFTKTITESGKEMVNGVVKNYKLVTKEVSKFDANGKKIGDTVTTTQKVYEEIAATVKDTVTSTVDTVENGIQTTTKTVTETLTDGTEQTKKVITETCTDIVNGTLVTVEKIRNIAADGTETTTKEIKEASSNTFAGLVKGWKAEAGKGVLGTFNTLMDAVKKKDWQTIGEWALSTLYNGLAPENKKLVDDFGNQLIQQVNKFLAEKTGDLSQKAWDFGGKLADSISKGLSTALRNSNIDFSAIGNQLAAFLGSVGTTLGAFAAKIGGGLSGIAGSMGGLSSIVEGAGGLFAKLGSLILSNPEIAAVLAIVAGVASLGAAIWAAASGNARNKSATVNSTISDVLTGADGTLWDYEQTSRLPQHRQRPPIEVNQYIYSKAQTAADLMREAQYEQERAVLQGV